MKNRLDTLLNWKFSIARILKLLLPSACRRIGRMSREAPSRRILTAVRVRAGIAEEGNIKNEPCRK